MTTPFPSELALDRYLLGEATPEETRLITEWLAADPDARALLSRRKSQADAAVAPVPEFTNLAEKVGARRAGGSAWRRRFPVIAAGIAAATLCLVAVSASRLFRPDDGWRAKGGAPSCIIKHGSEAASVLGKAPCTRGDTVQLYHGDAETPWVMALFSERGGAFTPCTGVDSAFRMARSSRALPLPFSIVIDTSRGVLELAVVTSERPFTAKEAINSISGAAGSRLRVTRFRLIREQP